MDLPGFLTLPYWNQLAREHIRELVLVLTATVVVLLDRQVRRLVHGVTRGRGRVFRFGLFLLVCSVGYTALSLGAAWVLREGLLFRDGAYSVPLAAVILLLATIGAERKPS